MTFETILATASALILLATAFGVVLKAIKPLKTAEQRLNRGEIKIANNKKNIEALQKDLTEVLLSVSVMLSHMESGNNTGEIKKRSQELQEYLIKR